MDKLYTGITVLMWRLNMFQCTYICMYIYIHKNFNFSKMLKAYIKLNIV